MTTPKNPGSNPMFSFEGKTLRIVKQDGLTLFITQDICNILGANLNTNGGVSTNNLRRFLDEDEMLLSNFPIMGRTRSLVTESGLYKMVMRCDKPAAKRFQNWVTREVLPALRQDGMYVMGEEKVKTGEMSEDELVLKAMTLLQGKVSRVTQERDTALATINKHLLNLTVQEWLANNGHYAHMRDAQELGRRAKTLAMEKGLGIGRETKLVPHPYNPGEKIQSKVNVYPLSVLDTAGKAMGFAANMKVA